MNEGHESSAWPRRVGLYGTHNYKPFEVVKTELDVKIVEAGSPQCTVEVRHYMKAEHHTACLWYPISDLNGATSFSAAVNGERLMGSLQRAVTRDETAPHPMRSPREPNVLYYFFSQGVDPLTDLERGSQIELRLVFKCNMMPVELAAKKWHPCFMLPVASCFPRGVDEAKITLKMKELIREVYCVDPNDVIYPMYNGSEAEVSFKKEAAISVSTDLFILGIDTGPKIIHDWDAKSLALLIFAVVTAFAIHQASSGDTHAADVFS